MSEAPAVEERTEDEQGKVAVSLGPTWGPETAEDLARREPEQRGWHPPGGPF
jgi:hypothetical protein